MALYSDMNGFPESGFPVLVDMEDRLTLNTLYYSPIKHLGYKIDVVGNNRLLGALVVGGALSGVTSLSMGGALSGVSTIGASGNVTLSGGDLIITSGNILMTSGSIGSVVSTIRKIWANNLYIKNRPECGEGDFVALVSDFANLSSRTGRIGNQDNYTEFEPDGTMKMVGNATVYDDLLGDVTGVKTTGTGVSINATQSSLDYTTAANLSDYAYFNYQISHKWKIGSSIFPHIHFEQNNNAVPNWLIQYRWQKQGQEKTTSWTNLKCTTLAFTYTSGTLNQIAYSTAISAPVDSGLSDIIQIRILRDNANTSGVFSGADAYSGWASITSVDMHYEIDTLGSRSEYSK